MHMIGLFQIHIVPDADLGHSSSGWWCETAQRLDLTETQLEKVSKRAHFDAEGHQRRGRDSVS